MVVLVVAPMLSGCSDPDPLTDLDHPATGPTWYANACDNHVANGLNTNATYPAGFTNMAVAAARGVITTLEWHYQRNGRI